MRPRSPGPSAARSPSKTRMRREFIIRTGHAEETTTQEDQEAEAEPEAEARRSQHADRDDERSRTRRIRSPDATRARRGRHQLAPIEHGPRAGRRSAYGHLYAGGAASRARARQHSGGRTDCATAFARDDALPRRVSRAQVLAHHRAPSGTTRAGGHAARIRCINPRRDIRRCRRLGRLPHRRGRNRPHSGTGTARPTGQRATPSRKRTKARSARRRCSSAGDAFGTTR
jgi:hypothetical protein